MASFFRSITENWKLKTLAFAIAVLLWVVVSAEQVTTNWIPVPVEVQVTDSRYRAVAPDPGTVEVRFQGAGRDLLQVAVSRPPVRLTVAEVTDTTGEYQLNPRMVLLSGQSAVSALDVRPSTVRLRFTRIDSRLLRVQPRLGETLGSEYGVVDSVLIEPAEVRVTGRADRVADMAGIFTEPFELTPGDTVFNRVIRLDTAGLAGLELSAATVTVSGRVDRVVDRLVQNVPVDVGPGIGIVPERVTVRLRGPERTVRSISPASLRVAVSIGEIPERLPIEGLAVPLRVDRVRPGVQATVVPSEARLVPLGQPPDSVSLGTPQATPPAPLVDSAADGGA